MHNKDLPSNGPFGSRRRSRICRSQVDWCKFENRFQQFHTHPHLNIGWLFSDSLSVTVLLSIVFFDHLDTPFCCAAESQDDRRSDSFWGCSRTAKIYVILLASRDCTLTLTFYSMIAKNVFKQDLVTASIIGCALIDTAALREFIDNWFNFLHFKPTRVYWEKFPSETLFYLLWFVFPAPAIVRPVADLPSNLSFKKTTWNICIVSLKCQTILTWVASSQIFLSLSYS